MSCGGGHLGFFMHTKKNHYLEDNPRNMQVKFAFTGIEVSENNFKYFPMWSYGVLWWVFLGFQLTQKKIKLCKGPSKDYR